MPNRSAPRSVEELEARLRENPAYSRYEGFSVQAVARAIAAAAYYCGCTAGMPTGLDPARLMAALESLEGGGK